jgi:CRISPR system Cascade subunit CasE
MSAFHETVGSAGAREVLGILYRLELDNRDSKVVLQVQSKSAPQWSVLPPYYLLDTGKEQDNPACKSIDEPYQRLRTGMWLRFRLRANCTKKIDTKSNPEGHRRNGKRVELRKEEEQVAWLRRRGELSGFSLPSIPSGHEVPSIRIIPEDKLTSRISGQRYDPTTGRERGITFGSILFEGVLQITNVDDFRKALEKGLGPGKAYGFGLLSVAPLSRDTDKS